MLHILGSILLLGSIFSVAFFQLSTIAWSAFIGVTLVLLTAYGLLPILLLIIAWPLYLGAAFLANAKHWRQQTIIQPALSTLKQKMPAISDTEREALEAGNTWWEKELFCGRPQWKRLFNMKPPGLTPEEQSFLDNEVETLCNMLNDFDIVNRDRDLPKAVWDYLKEHRFFGLVIPQQFGGHDFSALAHSTIVTKIATRSMSTAVNTMVPNSLGPAELLLHYGTDEQKNHYLPRLARGQDIPCFALTAPEAGSDAGAMPDSGVVCKGVHEGKEIVGIRLNWDKRYITLAPIATLLGLAFKLSDPDQLLSQNKEPGITLCLIPTNHPGVEIGSRHFPLQLAFMNGPTRGKDVFIPLDWIIGGQAMAGQGWRMLMECLSIGRSISLPALATACGKITYRLTGAYARIRRQFNSSISSFEGIEEALGTIAGYTYTLEAARIFTAGAVDLKVKPSIASAIAKYHMTEMARKVVEAAMDIHAGHMIQVGPRNFLANMHLAIPISITVEGANILTRNLIIFGQGAVRCHPYLLKEVELITAEKTDINALDKVLMSHIGYFVSNAMRSLFYGITGGRFINTTSHVHQIKKLERQLTRMSAALALLSDTSLILLGGSLKRRERLSARLGDVLSQLYLASAVLKYFNDTKEPLNDIDTVTWSVKQSLYRVQVAMNEVTQNFPQRALGKLLRCLIFPWGAAYRVPNDALNKAIVAPMLSNSPLRDRLTKHCFISENQTELSHRLDLALTMIDGVEASQKKISAGIKNGVIAKHLDYPSRINAALEAALISAEEAHQLSDFEALRQEIIKVNEFSFDLEQVLA
ncbi:MAG TPA: acyl-CoA dehydrogenase [Gammaproteobacteria bacterium]|nr:acyl-CoA dehydrogenase [Gammaproteobacteria bacterium]